MDQHSITMILESLDENRQLASIQSVFDELKTIPQGVAGEHRYRFLTFSARGGIPLLDQFSEHESTSRRSSSQGGVGHSKTSGGAGGVGGSAKFPRKQDIFLRKILESEKELEKGWIRQFFVYIDTTMHARLANTVDIPEQFFETKKLPKKIRARPEMLRLSKFECSSIEKYLKHLKGLARNRHKDLESTVYEIVRNREDSISGPENYFASLSRSDSPGGILVEIDDGSEIKTKENIHAYEMRYCPLCVEEIMPTIERSLTVWNSEGIVLPPIPNLSMPLDQIRVFCTENKHRGHDFSECINSEDLENRANESRVRLGMERHSTINIRIKLERGQEKPPWKWAWVCPSKS